MRVTIDPQCTLRSMDYHLDQRQTGEWLDSVTTSMASMLAETGASCKRDGMALIVERADGRGLIQACRAAIAKYCGRYGEVSVS